MVGGMEMREFDMSDSETEFLLDPTRDHPNTNNASSSNVTILPKFPRNRRKRVRKLGSILRFACGYVYNFSKILAISTETRFIPQVIFYDLRQKPSQ